MKKRLKGEKTTVSFLKDTIQAVIVPHSKIYGEFDLQLYDLATHRKFNGDVKIKIYKQNILTMVIDEVAEYKDYNEHGSMILCSGVKLKFDEVLVIEMKNNVANIEEYELVLNHKYRFFKKSIKLPRTKFKISYTDMIERHNKVHRDKICI